MKFSISPVGTAEESLVPDEYMAKNMGDKMMDTLEHDVVVIDSIIGIEVWCVDIDVYTMSGAIGFIGTDRIYIDLLSWYCNK